MSLAPSALFVRHRALPGKREEVRRIWEKFVRPRAEANSAHLEYYFCFDDGDPDVVCVFQLYTDADAAEDFRNGAWYSDYLAEVATVVAAPPQLTAASLVWAKPIVAGHEHRRQA
ncbi:MAG TPA: antibiotic biosynthesis monooxygenase [Pirellulaceae bacterium]|nr:antibiotic biosynthesis monooxygenase [Pirellulaceae bacterium]HMO91795.1 antibiotic biosynthesis monooxygenase [Pirellulaceae bacterium]HMP69594.1 antibiotic biosynthesis monooxygenase [Pirellulaceae bacterium]